MTLPSAATSSAVYFSICVIVCDTFIAPFGMPVIVLSVWLVTR